MRYDIISGSIYFYHQKFIAIAKIMYWLIHMHKIWLIHFISRFQYYFRWLFFEFQYSKLNFFHCLTNILFFTTYQGFCWGDVIFKSLHMSIHLPSGYPLEIFCTIFYNMTSQNIIQLIPMISYWTYLNTKLFSWVITELW